LTRTSPIKATDAHISVIGHATPEDLQEYLSNLDVANGTANRFILVASVRPQLVPSPPRMRQDLKDQIATYTKEALGALAYREDLYVPRTETAEAMWREVYPALSREQPGLLGALLARGPAHVTRLELLFALLAKAPARDAHHLTAAVAWWNYA